MSVIIAMFSEFIQDWGRGGRGGGGVSQVKCWIK